MLVHAPFKYVNIKRAKKAKRGKKKRIAKENDEREKEKERKRKKEREREKEKERKKEKEKTYLRNLNSLIESKWSMDAWKSSVASTTFAFRVFNSSR